MGTVLRARRGRREDGVATPIVAAVAAAVLVVLAGWAVVLSTREDDASVAPKSAPKQASPEARAQMLSGLKNAATGMELWSTDNGGTYAGACDGTAPAQCPAFDSAKTGVELPPGVTVVVVSADSNGYCLRATHEDIPPEQAAFYSSDVGSPSDEPCI